LARGYDYANTEAALVMKAALERANAERGLSIRKIGSLLGYNQAVVLSHMALGRVPIPLDRAEDIAEVLQLDKATFLRLVAVQRHPEVNWELLAHSQGHGEDPEEVTSELELIAGMPLRLLSPEHKAVLREVVGSAHPRRRWLSEHEVPVITMLRAQRDNISELGLDEKDLAKLQSALAIPTGRA